MGACLGFGITAKKVGPDMANLGTVLGQIAAAGCTTAELSLAELGIISGGRILRPQIERAKRICREHDLRLTIHGPLAINLCLSEERVACHLAALHASLEAASELGGINYVMHAGYLPMAEAARMEEAYALQRDRLAGVAERARKLGVIVCVENVFSGYDGDLETPSPSRLARELAEIDHPFIRATLDFSHARLHAAITGGDFLAEIPVLASFAKHVHVHDSFGRPDDSWAPTPGERMALGQGDIHLPIGWGDAPWDRIFEVCEFPDGVIFNAEPVPLYWHAVPEIAVALRDFAGRARIAD